VVSRAVAMPVAHMKAAVAASIVVSREPVATPFILLTLRYHGASLMAVFLAGWHRLIE
jgi:hypothetical protein